MDVTIFIASNDTLILLVLGIYICILISDAKGLYPFSQKLCKGRNMFPAERRKDINKKRRKIIK